VTGRSLRSLLLTCCLAATAGGCALTFDATTLGVDASMAAPAGSAVQGEAFTVNRSAVYLFGGLLPVARPSLRRVLAAQATSDARVASLRVRVRSRWSDVLITVLTAGLVVPRSVTYEGVILRP
jgi:hypothetical protein